VRQLYSARVKQQEPVQNTGRQFTCIQSRLDLLTEDLSFLIRSVYELVIVLHFRLLLSDLDHAIQIGDFDRESLLVLSPIHKAFMCSLAFFVFRSISFASIDMTIDR